MTMDLRDIPPPSDHFIEHLAELSPDKLRALYVQLDSMMARSGSLLSAETNVIILEAFVAVVNEINFRVEDGHSLFETDELDA